MAPRAVLPNACSLLVLYTEGQKIAAVIEQLGTQSWGELFDVGMSISKGCVIFEASPEVF